MVTQTLVLDKVCCIPCTGCSILSMTLSTVKKLFYSDSEYSEKLRQLLGLVREMYFHRRWSTVFAAWVLQHFL